ncbi:SPX domain family protein [Candida parapsilosis]|uniref:RING-type domain-containing protein n=2 Tax=Candida parapsilosis TaxID=5480 RepID=G8BHN7_CANPC|nr:uncharacterized protein CPAR2_501870 [Candida parapsilosis]KAF6044568.1 SPX domain family protein [Candida parapsilosis]KAF6045045.1 SPX domain family protein [Candida parapsilosis]KAF6048809.1 SPX domain family protein [Candida parapsilosis]KAF6060809.1 SPX domain family protein [Candida parapsilosis]KAI5900919.1 hypothetical protein K4G60_g44 [Candida parapsilosis]
MKFAKTLEQTLAKDIPEEWVEAAIKYKALKKTINKVVDELQFLGLEKNKLKLILNDKVVDISDDESTTSPSNPIIAEYTLTKPSPDSHTIKPMLKITLDFSHEEYSSDKINQICHEIKEKIEGLLNEDESEADEEKIIELTEDGGELKVVSSREGSLSPSISPQSPHTSPPLLASEANGGNGGSGAIGNKLDKLVLSDDHKRREIYIMLNSDSKFFKMLEEELEALDRLRKEEEQKIIEEVQQVAQAVAAMKDKTSELYKWRELFRLYLDSEVYFKYNELDHQQRDSDEVEEHLTEFLTNVNKTGILTHFKKKQSLETYNQFVKMNFHLLKMLQFQTINTEALRKILKKFDKQTSLGIQEIYPKLVSSDHIFVSGKSLAQSICYIMQTSVLQLIPQLDDYSCPICTNIAYKPIRLACGHLFCVSCLVKMKERDKTDCPFCRRHNAILEADSSNLDIEAMQVMKKYFPVEVKEKLRDRSKERYHEFKGNDKCIVS